jgi:hypothetical protein
LGKKTSQIQNRIVNIKGGCFCFVFSIVVSAKGMQARPKFQMRKA